MGFSSKIKNELLIQSARRCCVCRKYKGVGVEVHHIDPKSRRGKNSIDNGIVLCFDCHCAAGHYNKDHPRGTRFSPEELRTQKEEWFRRVAESGIQSLEEEFTCYHVRHLVCTSHDCVREIVEGKKKDLPFSYNYLMKNKIFKCMKKLLREDIRILEGNYSGNSYRSWDDFYSQNPEFAGETSRHLIDEDIGPGKIVNSNLFRKIVNEGFPPSELGIIRTYTNECGADDDRQVFSSAETLRPAFVFAQLTNTNTTSFTLSKLLLKVSQEEFCVRELDQIRNLGIVSEIYDNLKLFPGESLLIPEGILLMHESDFASDYEAIRISSVDLSEQIISLDYHISNCNSNLFWITPCSLIEGFLLRIGTDEIQVPINSFDPGKTYLINRHWCCGSCPHLYFYHDLTGWRYWGELFAHQNCNDTTSNEICLPEGVSKIHIAETNYETSYFQQIRFQDTNLLHQQKMLNRGDFLEFPINVEGGLLIITGHYSACIMKSTSHLHYRQNKLLRLRYERSLQNRR